MNAELIKKPLLGINISVIDQPELLDSIGKLVRVGTPSLVNNVNIHACNLAFDNPEFRHVLNRSEIVFCDGFGVKLAGWLTGKRLGQRMTPPDWIDDLFVLCEREGSRLYFIGDEDEVVERFAEDIRGKYPGLQIAGFRNGFFNLKDMDVLNIISESKADIIITGMGMPRQELWAWEAKRKLDNGVIIATGALFRWYTGYEKRAPKWMTDSGLEWLARLICNPVRHFKRYVIGIPKFFIRVIICHWFGFARKSC